MNLGRRILRLAKQRVLHGLRAGTRPGDPAREELEGHLRVPPTAGSPQGRPRQTARPSSASSGGGGGGRSSDAASTPGTGKPGAGKPGAGKSQPNAAPKSPPPPPPHPYAAEYRLLGVAVGSDLPAVRAAWRMRVKENHPDRFAGDPDAQRRAADRLRAINEAYQVMQTHLSPSKK